MFPESTPPETETSLKLRAAVHGANPILVATGGPAMQCNSTHLRRIALLRSLPKAAVEDLASQSHACLLKRGTVIYRQGDPQRAVHFLCAGAVKLTRSAVARQERILALIGSGDVLDGGALLDQTERTHTATALGPSVLAMCSGEVFAEILLQHPRLGLGFSLNLSRRLREMERRLVDLTSGSVRERLSGALLHLGESFGVATDDGTVIQLPLRQREIGQYIGASREVTSTLLNQMRRQQLIDFGPDWIRLHSVDALGASSEGADAVV